MLADGTTFEGEAIGWSAPGGVADRRGRFQHRADRLPGGASPTRPTPARSSASPIRTSATTAINPADDESRRPFCRGVIVRDLARRPSSWRSHRSLERLPRATTAARASPASTPAASPATCATPAPCPAPSGRPAGDVERAALHQAALDRAGDRRASIWSPRSPPPSPTPSGDGPLRVVAYDFGIKRTILRHLGRLATVEVVPARTPGRRGTGPPSPTGCSCPTDPATRPRSATPATPSANCSGEVPIFGICLGHQLLATALGGQHLQAAVRPPRRQPPGPPAGDRGGGDHQPEPQLRGRRRQRCPTPT